jgi:hypothetical protein
MLAVACLGDLSLHDNRADGSANHQKSVRIVAQVSAAALRSRPQRRMRPTCQRGCHRLRGGYTGVM